MIIIKDPNPILRSVSQEVAVPLSQEDESLAKSMLEYLKASQAEGYQGRSGAGLAAPQVGQAKRIIAIYVYNKKTASHEEHLLANPSYEVSNARWCYVPGGEGCLSVDGAHPGLVMRHLKVVVKGYDILARKQTGFEARGFAAAVAQHEIDHLNGILFYDRIDPGSPFAITQGAVEAD